MNDHKRGSPEIAKNIVKAASKVVGLIFHCVAAGRPHPIGNSLLEHSQGKITPMQVLTYVVAGWEDTGRICVAFLENTMLPCGKEGGREGNSLIIGQILQTYGSYPLPL